MFYIFRFNAAMAGLGVDPRFISQEYRAIGQQLGKAAGCNPKEAALLVLGEMPLAVQATANPAIAKLWASQGKIDISNPALKAAFINLGWADFF